MEGYEGYRSLALSWATPGVMRVAFNRPERRNALDDLAHGEISRIWHELDRDNEVASILVCGEGDDFCAGGEFELVEDMLADRDQRRRTMGEAQQLVYGMINCSKPIVSAIRGRAVGGGLAVALLADISIATHDAQLLDGHVRIGLAAGDHAVLIWPMLCGLAKAKYHLLLNEPMSGAEAERLGLVALAVDDSELDTVALDTASRLAASPPAAVSMTKYALNNWLRMAGPTFDLSAAFETMSFDTAELERTIRDIRQKKGARL